MKWTKDQVLTDTVWNFLKNKVHPLFPNVGIKRKAMQRLFFHNLALHSVLLSLEQSLSFLRWPAFTSGYLHYMRESVGGAKQAAM